MNDDGQQVEAIERESMEFDVVIVGAGPSGLSAAIRFKQVANEAGEDLSVATRPMTGWGALDQSALPTQPWWTPSRGIKGSLSAGGQRPIPAVSPMRCSSKPWRSPSPIPK